MTPQSTKASGDWEETKDRLKSFTPGHDSISRTIPKMYSTRSKATSFVTRSFGSFSEAVDSSNGGSASASASGPGPGLGLASGSGSASEPRSGSGSGPGLESRSSLELGVGSYSILKYHTTRQKHGQLSKFAPVTCTHLDASIKSRLNSTDGFGTLPSTKLIVRAQLSKLRLQPIERDARFPEKGTVLIIGKHKIFQ